MAMADVIARLSVWLGMDTAAFEKGADISEKRLKQMERSFVQSGKKIEDLGRKFTIALSVPIAAAGAAIVKSAADFEGSMIKLGISSQATSAELKEMSDLALKLGKDTIFGAFDAANAMDELAKSGLSARDIIDGAAAAAVNLASATGSELSPAANAVTDTMNQFKLTTAQLPDAVNQITGAVNQSKLDFQDYALAIGQAGGVAGGLGVSFTDFNTVLAATSSLFASGSDAGTSFKTFLSALTGNSKQAKEAIASFGLEFFNANGSLKSMADIAEQLRTKLGGLNDEAKNNVLKTIFGNDAMRTAIGLMQQGADGLDQVAAAIKRTDAAAQAQERLKGFYGQLENLKGAVETLAIRIGQSGILEAITSVITALSDFVDALSEASPGVLRFIVVTAGIAAVVGPTAIAIGALTRTFAPLFAVIKTQLIPAFLLFRLELVALGTTGGATAVAMRILAVAVRGLLIATGVGAAIAVLAGAIYLVMQRTNETVPATKAYTQALESAQQASSNATTAANNLASAHGKAREEALRAAIAERELTKQKLAGAQASLILAEYEAIRARAKARDTARLASGAGPGEGVQGRISGSQARSNKAREEQRVADANVKAAEETVIELTKARGILDKQIAAATAPVAAPKVSTSAPASGDSSKTPKGPKDRTEELANRAAQDLFNLQIEELRARSQLSQDVNERADLEREILAKERAAREADLAAAVKSGDLTQEQAQAQRDILDLLYGKRQAEAKDGEILVEGQKGLYKEQIERERRLQVFQESTDIAEAEYQARSDALRLQFDLADTEAERKRIALDTLAAEDAYLRSKLEAVIANQDLAKAVRDQAQIELNALNATAGARRESVSRQNETQVDRYLRDLRKTPAQINEAIDAIKIDGLQSLNNQIADAIVNFKSMGDVFANVIKQMIADLIRLQLQKSLIEPLANFLGLGSSLSSSSSSGLSSAGSALGKIKIPGFAVGTNFAPGGLSIVGERGPELVDLPRGARVTPNKDLAGMGGIATIVPSPYFDVVVDGHVYRAAPGIAQAGAAGGVAQSQRRAMRRVA